MEPERAGALSIEPLVSGDLARARYLYCQAQTVTAHCFAELGDFDRAMLHAGRALKVAQELELLSPRAMAESAVGTVHVRRGNIQEALLLCQRWLQTYAATELPQARLVMATFVGEVFNMVDQLENAIALFEPAWQFADSKSIFALGPRLLALLSQAYGRAGRLEEAMATGRRALDLARQLAQRGDEAVALYRLGDIYSHGAPANTNPARERYEEALVLAHELDMRPLEAQCHFALGALASNMGDKQEAQQQLTLALTMFREMSMKHWPEKAASALNAL